MTFSLTLRLIFCSALGFVFCSGPQSLLGSAILYADQTSWQNAIANDGLNPLINVSFDSSAWTQTTTSDNRGGSTVTVSSAVDGMVVSFTNTGVEGQSRPPVVADNALSGGFTTRAQLNYWTFSQPIYAFGANYSIATCGPPGCPVVGVPTASGPVPGPTQSGFWGLIYDVPVSELSFDMYTCGNNTSFCSQDFTMTDLQVSTRPPSEPVATTLTPEPLYWPILLLALPLAVLRCRNRGTTC